MTAGLNSLRPAVMSRRGWKPTPSRGKVIENGNANLAPGAKTRPASWRVVNL